MNFEKINRLGKKQTLRCRILMYPEASGLCHIHFAIVNYGCRKISEENTWLLEPGWLQAAKNKVAVQKFYDIKQCFIKNLRRRVIWTK